VENLEREEQLVRMAQRLVGDPQSHTSRDSRNLMQWVGTRSHRPWIEDGVEPSVPLSPV
jgi:hypothetical protein